MSTKLVGVLNQVVYPGVVPPGDIDGKDTDDCTTIATFWAVKQAGYTGKMPGVQEFRSVGGMPDHPNRTDGGWNSAALRALRDLIPTGVYVYANGWTSAQFFGSLMRGRVASVSLVSARLPSWMQYGFKLAHQAGFVWDGEHYRIANPLAPNGSEPLVITEDQIMHAAGALYQDNLVYGILIAPFPVVPVHHIAFTKGTLFYRYITVAGKIVTRREYRTGGFSAQCSEKRVLHTIAGWQSTDVGGTTTGHAKISSATVVHIQDGGYSGWWVGTREGTFS